MYIIQKKKDSERANYWYLTAAEQGNSYAQYEIGLYYSEYIRISNNYKRRDINKALFWLKQAGEQDHINALLLLGDIYRDVEYYDTAKIYWKQAASLGSEEALKKIEKIYE